MAVVLPLPVRALHAVDQDVGKLLVRPHQVPKLHGELLVPAGFGNAPASARVLHVGRRQLDQNGVDAPRFLDLDLLAGLDILVVRKADGLHQHVVGRGGRVRHDEALLVPLVHPLAELSVGIGRIQVHHLGTVGKHILQNSAARKIVVGDDLLHTAVRPRGHQRVQVGPGFLHLYQHVVHIVPCLDRLGIDAQLVEHRLVHRKTGGTGTVRIVRYRVQNAVNHGARADLLGLQRKNVLAVLGQQIVQGRGIAVRRQRLNAAGETVDIEQVPLLAGGHGEVRLFRVEVAGHFDLHAELLTGDLAGCGRHRVDLLGIRRGVRKAPNLQGDDFSVAAAGARGAGALSGACAGASGIGVGSAAGAQCEPQHGGEQSRAQPFHGVLHGIFSSHFTFLQGILSTLYIITLKVSIKNPCKNVNNAWL